MNDTPSISIKEVNIAAISLQEAKKKKDGLTNGKYLYVNHKNVKLQLVLPESNLPYGAGNSEQYPEKYTMRIAFKEASEEGSCGRRTKNARDTLIKVDNRIRELIRENSMSIFNEKKPASEATIAERYKSFMKNTNEDDPNGYFLQANLQRKPLPKDATEKMTEEERIAHQKQFVSKPNYPLFVNIDGVPIECDCDNLREVIPPNCRVKPVVELAYIWVMTSTKICNPVWNVVHGLRITDKPVAKTIVRRDDDEEEEEEVVEEEDEEMDDAEGEEEEEEEEEEVSVSK